MRYLKLFENYMSVIDEINDILMSLRDDGVRCSVIFPLEDNLELIYVNIPNVNNSLVAPTISHLVDYMYSIGYDKVVSDGSIIQLTGSWLHMGFYKKTDRGELIVNSLSGMLNIDNNKIFTYKRGVLLYDNGIFYPIMTKLKISRMTFELFLKYVVTKELKLNVLIATSEWIGI